MTDTFNNKRFLQLHNVHIEEDLEDEQTIYDGNGHILARTETDRWLAHFEGRIHVEDSNGDLISEAKMEFSRRGETAKKALDNLKAEAEKQGLVFL